MLGTVFGMLRYTDCIPSNQRVLVYFYQLCFRSLHNHGIGNDQVSDFFVGLANQRPPQNRRPITFDWFWVFVAEFNKKCLHVPVAVRCLGWPAILTQETPLKCSAKSN